MRPDLTPEQKRYMRCRYYVKCWYATFVNNHRNQFKAGISAEEHNEFQKETGLQSRRIEIDPNRDAVFIPSTMSLSAKTLEDYPPL